jgi:hypothetical protein
LSGPVADKTYAQLVLLHPAMGGSVVDVGTWVAQPVAPSATRTPAAKRSFMLSPLGRVLEIFVPNRVFCVLYSESPALLFSC